MELWERFTTRARRAVVLAHNEAIGMGMPLISTEHLLMGLLSLSEGTAVEVLKGMGVAGVFGPGTSTRVVTDFIRQQLTGA